MAVLDQPLKTTFDNEIDWRIIPDYIDMQEYRDVPLQMILGLDSARSKFSLMRDGYKIEWIEDELNANADQLAAAIADDSATSITVDDGSKFQPGHIILIESEYLWVSAVNTTTNVLTVTRGFSGTAASHADNTAVYIRGMARLEGDDADYIGRRETTQPYNYTSIFQQGLSMSRTKMQTDSHGQPMGAWQYQVDKAVPELMRMLEFQLFHGARKADTPVRSMGGLPTFVTQTQAAGGAITKATIDAAMQKCFEGGSNPSVFVCNHEVAGDIYKLYDGNTSLLRVGTDENKQGLPEVTGIYTQFGEVAIVMDKWCPTSDAYILDPSRIGLYTLHPWSWAELAKSGDSRKAEVVGEFSLAVSKGASGHTRITGITT